MSDLLLVDGEGQGIGAHQVLEGVGHHLGQSGGLAPLAGDEVAPGGVGVLVHLHGDGEGHVTAEGGAVHQDAVLVAQQGGHVVQGAGVGHAVAVLILVLQPLQQALIEGLVLAKAGVEVGGGGHVVLDQLEVIGAGLEGEGAVVVVGDILGGVVEVIHSLGLGLLAGGEGQAQLGLHAADGLVLVGLVLKLLHSLVIVGAQVHGHVHEHGLLGDFGAGVIVGQAGDVAAVDADVGEDVLHLGLIVSGSVSDGLGGHAADHLLQLGLLGHDLVDLVLNLLVGHTLDLFGLVQKLVHGQQLVLGEGHLAAVLELADEGLQLGLGGAGLAGDVGDLDGHGGGDHAVLGDGDGDLLAVDGLGKGLALDLVHGLIDGVAQDVGVLAGHQVLSDLAEGLVAGHGAVSDGHVAVIDQQLGVGGAQAAGHVQLDADAVAGGLGHVAAAATAAANAAAGLIGLPGQAGDDGGRLSAGGGVEGHKVAQLVALDEAPGHAAVHGLQGVAADLVLVGEGLGLALLLVGNVVLFLMVGDIAGHHGAHILPGDEGVGQEHALAVALDDAVFSGPVDGLGVPGAVGHILEVALGTGSLHAFQSGQNGDEHGAGHLHGGGELVLAHADHIIILSHILDSGIEPVGLFHVGELIHTQRHSGRGEGAEQHGTGQARR